MRRLIAASYFALANWCSALASSSIAAKVLCAATCDALAYILELCSRFSLARVSCTRRMSILLQIALHSAL